MTRIQIDHYEHDISKSDILGRYLDSMVYPNIEKKLNIKIHRTVTDSSNTNEDLQYAGVDLKVITGEQTFLVDEKAQIEFLNNPLSTLGFEISSLINGIEKEGWFFADKKSTQRYFYATAIFSDHYVDEKKEKPILSVPEDIRSLEIWSIDRHALIAGLAKKGITKERCAEISSEYPKERRIEFPEITIKKQIYLTRSFHKDEKPVMLVIKKFILKNMGPSCVKVIWPL
jgi:hypothetical protein